MIDVISGSPGASRPPVSVVVPFFGDADRLRETVAAMSRIELRARDELIVVDNTPHGRASRDSEFWPARVVKASDHPSSYYARNVGAEAAANDWFLFTDADCQPGPLILDLYFSESPGDQCGAVAGEVKAQDSGLLARYAVSRGMLSQKAGMEHSFRPSAVTANLLVRRAAWHSVGGFHERIRSGGDTDFCWRIQEAGWTLDFRPEASVLHSHRESLSGLTRQVARHSAGAAWLNRRYPGSRVRPPLIRGLARSAAGTVAWTAAGQFERARFKAIDGAVIAATSLGFACSNASERDPKRRRTGSGIAVFSDSYPHLSETFVVNEARALKRLGCNVRVEALSRPARPLRGGCRGLRVNFREDDSLIRRFLDGLWLVSRHPFRALRDARSQARWREGGDHVTRLASIAVPARRIVRGGDAHLHAHFATSAALEAMRLARLLARPYSTAPHAIEIFARPTNLVEKLNGAKFVSTDCAYNVDHLRGQVDARTAGRIHEVVLGIDESLFKRSAPLPGKRVVGTVGRLVEKKGFAHLIEAVAILEDEGRPVDELLIAGDGPLRSELETLVESRGLSRRVRFLGSIEPEDVLRLLHEIDLFALPCVIAADGDRDSMPVVVKEALAMELPVVGSDLVGLPEMIKPSWGRLVPAANPGAIADAIRELLTLSLEQRAAMGAAGRAFVLERCNVDREAEKVARLVCS